MRKLTKEQRIKREKKRLLTIFATLDENKLNCCRALIDRAAFITVNLEDVEAEIAENGWTEAYKNGESQSGIKKSAAADVHISLTKNLNAIIKQLLEYCPPAERKSKLAEMMAR